MTTREEIFQWLMLGKELAPDATHMIVATDTFDYSDYPVYVPGPEHPEATDANEMRQILESQPMTKVMECYDLQIPLAPQLEEPRANHWPEEPGTEELS